MKAIGLFVLLHMSMALPFEQSYQQSELMTVHKSCYLSSAEHNIAVCKGLDALLPLSKVTSSCDNTGNGCLVPVVSFSQTGSAVSCNNALGIFLILIDIFCSLKKRQNYQQYLQQLSYDEFIEQFPHLVLLDYHICRIQKMLDLSRFGTLPEQVIARISLVQSSLCHPYGKVLESCAKKLYQLSFDHQSNFIFTDQYIVQDAYKEFYKKVPQCWKQLACKVKKVPSVIDKRYDSSLAVKVNNQYNQTLLDIIDAGLEENFPRLKRLCRKYQDKLVKRLYQYYIDQKVKRSYIHYDAYESADVDPVVQDLPIEQQQVVAKEMSEELIFRDFYKQELASWLLQGSQQEDVHAQYKLLAGQKKSAQLPLYEHYRFILLKNFIEKVCKGSDTLDQVYQEFFCQKGVLKKYAHCAYVKEQLHAHSLDDPLFHKAVNYALAIVDKEPDAVTSKLSEMVLQLVAQSTQPDLGQDMQLAYQEKIAFLYNVLSSGQYDEKLLDI